MRRATGRQTDRMGLYEVCALATEIPVIDSALCTPNAQSYPSQLHIRKSLITAQDNITPTPTPHHHHSHPPTRFWLGELDGHRIITLLYENFLSNPFHSTPGAFGAIPYPTPVTHVKHMCRFDAAFQAPT